MGTKKKKFVYRCCCCDLSQPTDVQALNRMIEEAKPVTYRTFRKYAVGLDQWAKEKGYGDPPGLTLKRDWAVSYHKSKIMGQPCYYLRWSAIEFIWIQFPRKESSNGEVFFL